MSTIWLLYVKLLGFHPNFVPPTSLKQKGWNFNCLDDALNVICIAAIM